MSFEIRPISEEEFQIWRAASLESYAAEKTKEGLSQEDAQTEALASFDRHLGEGRHSKNHHIYSLTLDGKVIGTLWWGLSKQGKKEVAWIYDIILAPSSRGKGFGRRVMEWAQQDVKAKGLDRLGLHVFGHNQVARNLYESLGFETTNLVMYKSL